MYKLDRNSLEQYLSSWKYVKSVGILTCGEDIAFDGSPESLPIFHVELTGILLKHDLLLVLYTSSGAGFMAKLPKLLFQSI